VNGRGSLHARLRAARPPDSCGEPVERAAVRVLARLAVLEAGARNRRGRGVARRAVAVGALGALAFLVPVSSGVSGGAREMRCAHPAAATVSWSRRVTAALGGDVLARRSVLHGGLPARAALLARAEARGPGAVAALDLLGQAGALRGSREVARVARLVDEPALARPAARLLAAALGPGGVERLGARLAEVPSAEAVLVDALSAAAAAGRRGAAVEALLRGAVAGRRRAAAAAVALAGAGRIGDVVRRLPHDLLRDPGVLSAMRRAPVTERACLVRLGARGEMAALVLAAAAGLRGVVAPLAARSLEGRSLEAGAAVDLLAEAGGARAWLALARALAGPAGARARVRLQEAPAAAATALAERARTSPREAPAALAALAARGDVSVLARLGEVARLAPEVVRALAACPGPAAGGALARLAARPALRGVALDALGRRLAGGQAEAGARLLALARAGQARAVLRVLLGCGAPGRQVLRAAAADPALGARAREALARDDARAPPARVARAGSAPRRSV
jgi:hypothetical protein